jgi:hypothetical protein
MQRADALDIRRGEWADDEVLSRPLSRRGQGRERRVLHVDQQQSKGRVKERPGDCRGVVTWRIGMAFEVCDTAEFVAEIDREG